MGNRYVWRELRRQAKERGASVYTLIEEGIRQVPIGAHGVFYHPYLLAGGERAPFTEPRARASYTNINVTHTIWDLLRATYEGVAFAMLDCYTHMPKKPKQITVCGGGANSAFWCQMFADVLGAEIVTVKGEELGARGVVLNNAVVQGFYPDYRAAVEASVDIGCRYQPDMKKHAQYERLYPLYQEDVSGTNTHMEDASTVAWAIRCTRYPSIFTRAWMASPRPFPVRGSVLNLQKSHARKRY